MMLKIRNGGSWVLRDDIARVSFGCWGEGRVRHLRDGIKTVSGSSRWHVRTELAVGRGQDSEYTAFHPDAVYLDPDRSADSETLELRGREGARLHPDVDELTKSGLLDASEVAAAQAEVNAAVGADQYEYPAWCACVLTNGNEVFYVFSEAYLLNDHGKTVEKIA